MLKTKQLRMQKLYLFLIFAIPTLVMAQPPHPQKGFRGGMRGENRQLNAEHKNRLQSLSVAYLTKAIQLTPEEAEKFWPVYNKYNEEVRRAAMDSTKKDVLEKQQEVLNIRKKYQKDFHKILSSERTQQLFHAEMEFRNMVKKELEERRKNMPPRRRDSNKPPIRG
ncbi:MAG: hypothetical protein RL335_1497 [Bacteroidota bacterium]